MAKSMKPGGGGRFDVFIAKMRAKGASLKEAKGTAAKAGRKKYGKARFAAMAAKGRRKGRKRA